MPVQWPVGTCMVYFLLGFTVPMSITWLVGLHWPFLWKLTKEGQGVNRWWRLHKLVVSWMLLSPCSECVTHDRDVQLRPEATFLGLSRSICIDIRSVWNGLVQTCKSTGRTIFQVTGTWGAEASSDSLIGFKIILLLPWKMCTFSAAWFLNITFHNVVLFSCVVNFDKAFTVQPSDILS